MSLSRSEKKFYQKEILEWYAMMLGASAAMPEDEKLALQKWERTHVDGHRTGTSDWPGWEKYIGKKPVPPPRPDPFKKQLIPDQLRWQVWERDNFTCVHCGTRRNLTIDHIKAESLGRSIIFKLCAARAIVAREPVLQHLAYNLSAGAANP